MTATLASRLVLVASCLAAAAGAVPSAAAASPTTWTATADARACATLPGGQLAAGTLGGLVLLGADGAASPALTALDGLPGTRVHAVAAAPGGLWVGTEGGLARVALAAGADASGLSARVVRTWPGLPVHALREHDGALFVGTWGAGLGRLDPATGAVTPVPFAARVGERVARDRSRITSLAEHAGGLVVGTAGAGALGLRGGKLRLLHADLAQRWVWSVASHGGRLWLGTLSGLASLSGLALTDAGAHDVRALASLGGALLAGTHGEGLLALAGGRAHVVPGPPTGGAVWGLGGTSEAPCAATSAGLWRLDAGGRWAQVYVTGAPAEDVAALAFDGRRLWVGFFDRGLWTLDGGAWAAVGAGVIDPKINALAVEGRGASARLWVATARGLHRVGPGGAVRTYGRADGLPHPDVHAVAVLPSGRVVAGTGRGLALVDGDVIRPLGRKQGLRVLAVWAVAEGPDGLLLAGTSSGLYRERADGTWQLLTVASGHLADDWVTALVVRGATAWVGTYNAGVARLDLTGEVPTATQLGGGWVNLGGLTLDGDRLLAATMGGLLSRPASSDGPWQRLADAAAGQDVTASAPTPAGLWVSSRRGLRRLPSAAPTAAVARVP